MSVALLVVRVDRRRVDLHLHAAFGGVVLVPLQGGGDLVELAADGGHHHVLDGKAGGAVRRVGFEGQRRGGEQGCEGDHHGLSFESQAMRQRGSTESGFPPDASYASRTRSASVRPELTISESGSRCAALSLPDTSCHPLRPALAISEQVAGELQRGDAAGPPGCERVPRHRALELDQLGERPPGRQLCRGPPRARVVEQSNPEGGKRIEERQRHHVGAAKLEHALDAHFGKEGAQVIHPVRERGLRLLAARRLPGGEPVAEGLLPRIHVVGAVADEEHGHVQRPLHVAAVAPARLQHLLQQPAAGVVGLAPDLVAVVQPAGIAPGDDGAVGEHGADDGRDGGGGADLGSEVRLVAPVEVRLHRGGHQHHVQGQAPARAQRLLHRGIAALGHPGHLVSRPEGPVPGRQPADPLRIAPHLGEVVLDLAADVAERPPGRPRELELAAGLQRHRGVLREQRDGLAVLRVPVLGAAGGAGDGVEQSADSLRSVIGHRLERGPAHAQLLVLHADEPARRRPLGRTDVVHQLVEGSHRCCEPAEYPGTWSGTRCRRRELGAG